MNQRLTVQVEADIKNLERGLQRGERSVNNFSGEVRKGEQRVGSFARTTQVNAVPAMTSFSQVIQDAPYGIRGVANNITQLTSQMGYLAKSSGGVMGAMKALGSTLMGPAGILLAVSAVTSILVSYGDELFKAKDETKELADETQKAKEKIDEFIKSLNTLRQVNVSIDIGVAKEVATLDALRQQLENTANSDERRTSALEKLKSLYPSILKNYSDEKILANGLQGAYLEITNSINERVRSSKALDQIVKNESQIIKVNEKQKDTIKELAEAQETLNQRRRDLDNSLGKKTEAVAIGRFKEAQEAVDNLNNELNELASTRTKLSNQITQLRTVVSVVTDDKELKTNDGSKPKLEVEPTVDSAAIAELNRKIKEAQEEGAFLDSELAFIMPTENAIGEAGYSNNLNESWLTLESQFDEHKDRMAEKMTEYNSVMNQEAMMLSSIFGQMSNQIIDGLLEGEMSVESFVKSSIKALGSLLVNMAQQAIAEKLIGKAQMATDQGVASANAIVIASNAAAAMGPAGVLAYPGLLASQLALTSGAFGAIQAFNDGGMVGGGMATGDKVLARLNSGEMVLNQGQQRNLFRMLDGAHLGSGNSEPLQIVGESRIEGDTIITAYKRAEKNNSRIN